MTLIFSMAISEISTASMFDVGCSSASVIAKQPEPEQRSMAELKFFFYIHQ